MTADTAVGGTAKFPRELRLEQSGGGASAGGAGEPPPAEEDASQTSSRNFGSTLNPANSAALEGREYLRWVSARARRRTFPA